MCAKPWGVCVKEYLWEFQCLRWHRPLFVRLNHHICQKNQGFPQISSRSAQNSILRHWEIFPSAGRARIRSEYFYLLICLFYWWLKVWLTGLLARPFRCSAGDCERAMRHWGLCKLSELSESWESFIIYLLCTICRHGVGLRIARMHPHWFYGFFSGSEWIM